MDENKIINEEELEEVAGGKNDKISTYTVVEHDTLSRIAKYFKTTVDAIMSLNPFITDKNLIRVGWVLRVYNNR